jgi:hypothetical protein
MYDGGAKFEDPTKNSYEEIYLGSEESTFKIVTPKGILQLLNSDEQSIYLEAGYGNSFLKSDAGWSELYLSYDNNSNYIQEKVTNSFAKIDLYNLYAFAELKSVGNEASVYLRNNSTDFYSFLKSTAGISQLYLKSPYGLINLQNSSLPSLSMVKDSDYSNLNQNSLQIVAGGQIYIDPKNLNILSPYATIRKVITSKINNIPTYGSEILSSETLDLSNNSFSNSAYNVSFAGTSEISDEATLAKTAGYFRNAIYANIANYSKTAGYAKTTNYSDL